MVEFPIDVFDDVRPKDFDKHNKKHVTEDYVSENFKICGWTVYRPFNDTGIDIVVSKKVCPNDHTKWFEDTTTQSNCKVCTTSLMKITRFIQVKTREVTEGQLTQVFGYTLQSKDFRTDPRHVFLLYSDYTKHFIILPMYDYLKIFHSNIDIGRSHFGTPSFRKGNNKLNSLRYDTGTNRWTWSGRHSKAISFDSYVNDKGLELISKTEIDTKFAQYALEISKMKFELFYNYSRGAQGSQDTEKKIQTFIQNKIIQSPQDIVVQRKNINQKLSNSLSLELKDSINRYLTKFKDLKL